MCVGQASTRAPDTPASGHLPAPSRARCPVPGARGEHSLDRVTAFAASEAAARHRGRRGGHVRSPSPCLACPPTLPPGTKLAARPIHPPASLTAVHVRPADGAAGVHGAAVRCVLRAALAAQAHAHSRLRYEAHPHWQAVSGQGGQDRIGLCRRAKQCSAQELQSGDGARSPQ